jgi:hypothetical protein
MKYLALILIFAIGFKRHESKFPSFPYRSTITRWDSTKNWRIYKLPNFRHIFSIPSDSLHYLQSIQLNDDSIHFFLVNVKKLPRTSPVWMGCYLASYECSDGKIKKAIISQYAGFFYCQADSAFFQVDGVIQNDWLRFFSSRYQDLEIQTKK